MAQIISKTMEKADGSEVLVEIIPLYTLRVRGTTEGQGTGFVDFINDWEESYSLTELAKLVMTRINDGGFGDESGLWVNGDSRPEDILDEKVAKGIEEWGEEILKEGNRK